MPNTFHVQQRFWSHLADAKADPSLRWSFTPHCWHSLRCGSLISCDCVFHGIIHMNKNRVMRILESKREMHYAKVSVLINFSQKSSVFTLIIVRLHKIICFGCVLESPRRGDSNTHSQHMILWRNIRDVSMM